MAHSRLLLLLQIGVIASHLPVVQAEHTDFWCNQGARKNMVKKIEGLKKDMSDCVGSHMLPAPLQLPNVWVRPAKWANKTLQQKCAEVLGALRMFEDGVHGEMNQTTSQCQTSLLKRLGHHVSNYVGLINNLQIQNVTGLSSSHPVVQSSFFQTSLKKTLEHYEKLLNGKLEHLAFDLKDRYCKELI